MRYPATLLLIVLIATLTGCSTYADRLTEIRTGYFNGDLVYARRALDEALEKPKRAEADVLMLERAMIELAEGRPKDAERTLREVRDRFDELEGVDAGEQAWTMLTDDNAQAYSGEDYDKVLIRSLLAISNLLTDGQDAHAYAMQVIDKQQQIIASGTDASGENPKLAYQRVALGPYLHGVIREATHANYDDAARAHALVCNWQPDFKYGPQNVQRAVHGRHSAPGNGVLYVFAFVGAGPMKVESIEVPTQAAMFIADRVLSHNLNQNLPPTIAPIPVAKVVNFESPVQNVRVAVNGHPVGVTETITDVGKLAVQQYDAIYPQVVARAIVRRAVKKGIVYGAKELTGTDRGSLGSIAFDLAGIVWEATESADTRSWGLLPDKIQVLRIELPTGQHEIALQPSGSYAGGTPMTKAVEVYNGENTYMLCNFPGTRHLGQVLVNAR